MRHNLPASGIKRENMQWLASSLKFQFFLKSVDKAGRVQNRELYLDWLTLTATKF